MSAVLGIARREVRERRFLLIAAGVAGLLALVLGLPWARGFGETLTIMLFLAFAPAVALAVGSSLVGRDLAEGRLPFYFSRPLSAGALWAGKFLGGAFLVLGAFLCFLVPLTVTTGGIAPEGVAAWALVLIGLMTFAHVTTTMYRSGSWLLALDLGLGALFVTVFAAQLRRLESAGAGRLLFGDPLSSVFGVAMTVATAGMLAASAAQLAYGRADTHRGHVALSTAVWSFALAGLGGLALWGAWVLKVTPADLGGAGHPFFAAPRGSALLFKGASWEGRAGFSPIFLMDGRSGSFVRLPLDRVTAPAFTANGRTAVWVAPEVPWGAYLIPTSHYLAATRADWESPAVARHEYEGAALAVARLDGGAPAVEERPLERTHAVSAALAVDTDGVQAVLSGPSSVFLVDAAKGVFLASAPFPGVVAADFLPDGIVRLYRLVRAAHPTAASFVVLDWNPKDGSQVERARVPGEVRTQLLARGGDLAVFATGARQKVLLDAAGGGLRSFHSTTSDFPGVALVLSTGTVALSLGEEVRGVTPGGETVFSFPVGPRARAQALRETAPGELAVGLWAMSLDQRRTVFLDARTGAVRREAGEILPAGPRHGGLLPPPAAGSFATRLFTDLDGRLIVLESDGSRRELVGVKE